MIPLRRAIPLQWKSGRCNSPHKMGLPPLGSPVGAGPARATPKLKPLTRLLGPLAVALFLAAVPIFLITTNVRWVINAPILYSYGFDKYDITTRTGIERSELLSAGEQIRDYFNNGVEYIDVRVAIGGIRRSIYDSREVTHMKDVKGLVKGLYRVQELTGAYLAAFALIGILAVRRRFLPRLARYASFGGLLTLGLVLAVGLVSLVGFEQLFLAFHLMSFSNDFWQLGPSSYLLAMFPESFFLDATLWIVASTVLEAALLAAVPPALRRWRVRQAHSPVERRAAGPSIRQPLR